MEVSQKYRATPSHHPFVAGVFSLLHQPFWAFPMVFLWFSYGFRMVFPWVSNVFPWFSNGFPMVFTWFSHGFPMVFQWFSHVFPMGSQCFPMVFHGWWFFLWVPNVFPWFSQCFPMVFPWFGVAPFKRLKGDDQPPGGLRLQDLRGAVEPGDPADAGRGGFHPWVYRPL